MPIRIVALFRKLFSCEFVCHPRFFDGLSDRCEVKIKVRYLSVHKTTTVNVKSYVYFTEM